MFVQQRRPRSSTMWVSPQCTERHHDRIQIEPFCVRMYSWRFGFLIGNAAQDTRAHQLLQPLGQR
jgi:hypothetical protein